MKKTPNTFEGTSAPRAYVAGLGRGAAAFQTSAATGSIAPSFGGPPPGYVAGAGRGIGGFGDKKPDSNTLSSGSEAGGRFDRFLGYEGANQFSSGAYGEDDQFADAMYAEVDRLRERKRPKTSTASNATTLGSARAIADDFADLTSKMKQIPADEWLNLPEAQSRVKQKNKSGFGERFVPVTDSLLASAASAATTGTKREDLLGFSQARDQRLRVTLDRAGDSVLGQTVVDPHGFLNALNTELDTATQISDVKKARALLKHVTSTNPTHAPGWLAAARVEERAGNVSGAKDIMRRAREACPYQEDVWLESARLEGGNEAKSILALALSGYLPKSIELWLAAADLELKLDDAVAENAAREQPLGSWLRRTKKDEYSNSVRRDAYIRLAEKRNAILLKAIEQIPDSAKLWSHAYALELNDEKARSLLQKAISHCPGSVDFYISLARLETSPQTAQARLNEARRRFPGEARIWIVAGRLLEETETNAVDRIEDMIQKAKLRITAHMNRSAWLESAVQCQKDDYPATCEAIIRATLDLGVEDVDRNRTWSADAEMFEKNGNVLCARVVYDMMLEANKNDEDAWFERISFAKRAREDVLPKLAEGCQRVPNSQILWLMHAKEVWLAGDLTGARKILDDAFMSMGAGEKREEMWFAAAKLAQEVSLQEARAVYRRAREMCSESERVWIKSAVFERKFPDAESEENQLVTEALRKFPKSEKLWLMLGQIKEYRKEFQEARQVYNEGTMACTNSHRLWIALARMEEKLSSIVTARAVLASARMRFHNAAELWLASIRLEQRAQAPTNVVDSLLARALQALPANGELLAEQIDSAPEAKKQSVAKEAYKATGGENVTVTLAVAKVWWRKRPLDQTKVLKWIERAISLDPKYGDAWAALFRFSQERKLNTEDVIKRCKDAAPTKGERWVKISKARGNEDAKTEDILLAVAKISGADDVYF